MQKTAAMLILAVCALAPQAAPAAADRESLIEAWEDYVASLPGTIAFESIGEGVYRLEDADLPYEGGLRLVGALVRPAEAAAGATEFTHFGMVDFELVDLPVERLTSQSYYYWIADRQTLHYSEDERRWVDTRTYQVALTESYSFGGNFGALSFMLNYGIWALLIALIVFVFLAISRQAKKSRALLDETAAINRQARENLDRAAGMQDEVLAIARQTRDLQAENNALLARVLDILKR